MDHDDPRFALIRAAIDASGLPFNPAIFDGARGGVPEPEPEPEPDSGFAPAPFSIPVSIPASGPAPIPVSGPASVPAIAPQEGAQQGEGDQSDHDDSHDHSNTDHNDSYSNTPNGDDLDPCNHDHAHHHAHNVGDEAADINARPDQGANRPTDTSADATADTTADTAAHSTDTAADPDPDPDLTSGSDFNPDHYDWVPVRKVQRADGWSLEKQKRFIETLADTGSVTMAARAAGMSRVSAYKLRRTPGEENFAAAWEVAVDQATKALHDIALDRAMNGVDDPVLDSKGNCVYVRTRYNDRLLMFLLSSHAPQRYRRGLRDAVQHPRRDATALPPMVEAMHMLEPPAPPEPHKLMAPGELAAAIQCADMFNGELPIWDRDRGLLEIERGEAERLKNVLEDYDGQDDPEINRAGFSPRPFDI